MVRLLEALFEFCASLKLAVFTILMIATLLGIATFYEARYGMAAVQHLVFGSNVFMASMALLAVNVMSAALIRYPWKRKQTGFVVTHLGILTLLAGCLVSFRLSVDGRVSFRPGDSHNDIAMVSECVQVSVGGKHWVLPGEFWSEAGYPSAARALLPGWPEPKWIGPNPAFDLAEGVQLEVLDWLPAAKIVRELSPDRNGTPAAEVRISGTAPGGAPVEDTVQIVLPRGETGLTKSLFGGLLEVALWSTPSEADVAAFLAPPARQSLGELGMVTLHLGGESVVVPVSKDPAVVTKVAGGALVSFPQYLPQASIDGDQLLPAGAEPIAPIARVRIVGPDNVAREFLLSARNPYLTLQTAGPLAPGVRPRFDHPAMYAAISDGTRGRLHLLQGPDGVLYHRAYANEGVRSAGKVTDAELAKWMGISATVTAHFPAAVVAETFARADVTPSKLTEAMRAVRVAVTIDGTRREAWVARAAAPKGVDSPRGAATLAYGFESSGLPFTLAMVDSKKTNNPGTTDAATYESSMIVNHRDGTSHRQLITMNEPLTVGNIVTGYTFYQAGFDDALGQTVSTLSVRRDPGTVLKYAGSLIICLGIFLSFYMKAYFQKPAPASAAGATVPSAATTPNPLAGGVA